MKKISVWVDKLSAESLLFDKPLSSFTDPTSIKYARTCYPMEKKIICLTSPEENKRFRASL
jgi:hypothetical protein